MVEGVPGVSKNSITFALANIKDLSVTVGLRGGTRIKLGALVHMTRSHPTTMLRPHCRHRPYSSRPPLFSLSLADHNVIMATKTEKDSQTLHNFAIVFHYLHLAGNTVLFTELKDRKTLE